MRNVTTAAMETLKRRRATNAFWEAAILHQSKGEREIIDPVALFVKIGFMFDEATTSRGASGALNKRSGSRIS